MQVSQDAEWLETDGRGGFASGTTALVRTRRYHALLLDAATPPTGRAVLVNGLEVWADTPHGHFALSSQRYAPDTLYPDGVTHVTGFTTEPWPTWSYTLPDGARVEHSVFIARATGETVLQWTADRPMRLTARPLLSGRDYHSLHRENPAFDFTTARDGAALVWRPYPDRAAITARGNFAWTDDGEWFRRFLYIAERDRGLDDEEDLASPGVFAWNVTAQTPAVLILRARTPGDADATALATAERARRPDNVAAYLAGRPPGETILAGFPWFTDWGRDTFIAMRGLLLARGRLAEAAAILLAWSDQVSEGMLPNRFPDGHGPPEFNAVDASLWFIVVVHELMEAGGTTPDQAAKLQTACLAILDAYCAGTRFGIAADPEDGLLRAGVPGVQLTWMDAKVGDWVVTPRIGKPVEIQALWVNALAIAARWPGGDRWVGRAIRARDSVVALFPDRTTGGLIDVLDADGVRRATDRSIRPNQVLAAGGLPIPVLTPHLIQGVVALAERELLTPLGLRTLSPHDPAYRGQYRGSPLERDGAYHQGTAWPWLLGPFVAAWLAARGNTAAAHAEARSRFLAPLQEHLTVAGLGHVSEVVDGDAPHTPGGCPFQAWSLGEMIRIEAMLDAPSAVETAPLPAPDATPTAPPVEAPAQAPIPTSETG
jgi:glycogen debranching enzyme